jgi:type IV pilus assembly protein PilY1
MMHAFDASNGNELFAYVPGMVHDNLINLTLNTFIDDHIYYVNSSPHAKSFGSSVYLAGGLGKGGKGVYSLNLMDMTTSPPPGASDVFNWELTSAGDSDMGYVYGRAYVTKTSAGPSVIFGNGYASDSGKAVLYVVNADTGAIIKKFDTSTVAGASVIGCNGMSSPAIIDTDVNGVNDLVYAGDLYGNLWKFDLSGPVANWSISYGGHPFFTAKDDAGNVQPITTEPDVMKHCSASRKGFIVVFGTGRYLNEDDLVSNVADQVFYGLYDWENDWLDASKSADDKFLGVFGSGGMLSNTTATLLMQEKTGTVTIGEEVFVLTSTNPIVYFDPATETGDHAGWYYVLPDPSERSVRNPSILNGIVIFITNTMTGDICSGTGASFLYSLDACSGAAPKKPQFDTDNDNDVDADDAMDQNPGGLHYDTTLFDPVAGPDALYINDTFGNIIEKPIPPDPPRMNYWILHE